MSTVVLHIIGKLLAAIASMPDPFMYADSDGVWIWKGGEA